MCTCGSTPPGITILPAASITRAAPASSVPGAATAAMVSPLIATSQRATPCGVTTSPPRMMRSSIGVILRYDGSILAVDRPSAHPADQSSDQAVLVGAAPQQRIGAETAPRRIGDEQRVDDGEEHVVPRPFLRVQIEAEPQVQRERHGQ